MGIRGLLSQAYIVWIQRSIVSNSDQGTMIKNIQLKKVDGGAIKSVNFTKVAGGDPDKGTGCYISSNFKLGVAQSDQCTVCVCGYDIAGNVPKALEYAGC